MDALREKLEAMRAARSDTGGEAGVRRHYGEA